MRVLKESLPPLRIFRTRPVFRCAPHPHAMPDIRFTIIDTITF